MASEAHMQERLIYELPPDPILRLMGQGSENPVQHVNQLRRSVAIGQRVNMGVEEVRLKVSEDVDLLIQTLDTAMQLAKVLKTRIDGLEVQVHTNNNLMEGFDEAVGAQLNELSQQHLNAIPQQGDVDHQ